MSTPPKFHIKQATTPSDLTAIRTLFTSYATSLGIDLTFQNFTSELSSLPGLYAPPTGSLLLALSTQNDNDNEAIGCVALRPLKPPITNTCTSPKKCCEMKRLYCTPSSRGLGVGKALMREIIREAERLGYEEVRLDTLPSMESARGMYRGAGFEETEAYYETPLEGTIFLAKKLGGGR
ncbi:hypothetical protein G7Y89_g15194 [Cudoniella acicularis]|uniref:N-acetyltransferase domain-containing protein n=1 Tax=Cudoniella acicularis TaxID=354080 RepID=A0A8H4VN92_9HELO|nr:hypothetical protein G7Y89_g15194 [Cudoniella acicularis]